MRVLTLHLKAEYWHAIARGEKTEEYRNSAALLKERGIEFDEENDDAHLIVKGRDCLIDFSEYNAAVEVHNEEHGKSA